MQDFTTTQLNTAAFLIASGYQLVDTRRNGRMIEFVFEAGAEGLAEEWTLRPSEAMRLVAKSFDERERLFRLLRDEMKREDRRGYGDWK